MDEAARDGLDLHPVRVGLASEPGAGDRHPPEERRGEKPEASVERGARKRERKGERDREEGARALVR